MGGKITIAYAVFGMMRYTAAINVHPKIVKITPIQLLSHV